MPILIAICAVPNPYVAVWLSVPSALVGAGYAPVIYAIAQSLSPPQSRSVTASVMMLFIGGGGMLFGPAAIGALSDLLEPRYGVRVAARRDDRRARDDDVRGRRAPARDAHADERSREREAQRARENRSILRLGIPAVRCSGDRGGRLQRARAPESNGDLILAGSRASSCTSPPETSLRRASCTSSRAGPRAGSRASVPLARFAARRSCAATPRCARRR